MRSFVALLYLEYAAIAYAATDSSRPRGVSPDFAKFYKDPKSFTCISNPSIHLSTSQINDDYCDCPDGSDEPGTAACSHLSPLSPHTPADTVRNTVNASLALPGFYCKNKGHIPSYVPFTNVNDGICDYDSCCDGSEEYGHVGGVKCEDRCKEIGKEWRKKDEARQKSLGNASRKRKELVAEAARLRLQVQDRLQSLGTEIEGQELKLKQTEQELAEVERREKGRVVKGSVSSKAGKLGLLVGLAKQRTNELRESLIRVRNERDANKGRLQDLEKLLTTFKEEYNPNFNDEGVKRAVRAWEDYAAKGKAESNDALDRDLDEISKEDGENGLNWDEYESEEKTELDVLYAFENYLPPTIRNYLDTKLRELRTLMISNGILADIASTSTGTSTETKAVLDARSRAEAARNDLTNSRKDLASHTEDLAKDFGPEDIFRALKGQCVSTDAGEYTYEVCFLGQTTQKPKKGGGHTNMGNYNRLERIMVDDEVPADGKGLGSGERIAMKHEGGQGCWNGPSRSTTVVLGCSEENEVWKIMEEEKCVYRMEVGTPAVCEVLGQTPQGGREEL
ncbi:hypothetical protein LTR95_006999 [Oleoguttula sp. CCFEE 5521]